MGEELSERPEKLLRDLIRFDTTNPPGNEAACINHISGLLGEAGLDPMVLGKSDERPCVVARLKGRGSAPPLLMYGHVDVVPTAGQDWSVDPFEGRISDGCVWGRGALDMKGGIAMMLSALLKTKAHGEAPAGDIVFAALSDEEAGGEYGAEFLAKEHGELFEGIKYAIGEFGGFPMYHAGRKFYAIQVSEKQVCWMKATVRGPGGHASLPRRGGTMYELAAVIRRLNENRLPVHLDPAVRLMLETMASEVPEEAAPELGRLLDPSTTDAALDEMGERGLMLDAMTHNTVNPTMVRGGSKINVVPSEVVLQMDGRLLPGFTPADMLSELEDLVGDLAEIKVIRYDENLWRTDMGLFDMLGGILQSLDPEGVPVPLMMMGCTDARFFSSLGIQSYGFTPMNLPPDFDFLRYVHAADERIPLESLRFGADAVYELLRRYGG